MYGRPYWATDDDNNVIYWFSNGGGWIVYADVTFTNPNPSTGGGKSEVFYTNAAYALAILPFGNYPIPYNLSLTYHYSNHSSYDNTLTITPHFD